MNSSVQSFSCVRLYDPMDRSTPGLPVHHQLPEFTQTHVPQVSDAIQPPHPLSSPSPPTLTLLLSLPHSVDYLQCSVQSTPHRTLQAAHLSLSFLHHPSPDPQHVFPRFCSGPWWYLPSYITSNHFISKWVSWLKYWSSSSSCFNQIFIQPN